MKISTLIFIHSITFSFTFISYVQFLYTEENANLFSWIFSIWFVIAIFIIALLSSFGIVEDDTRR